MLIDFRSQQVNIAHNVNECEQPPLNANWWLLAFSHCLAMLACLVAFVVSLQYLVM